MHRVTAKATHFQAHSLHHVTVKGVVVPHLNTSKTGKGSRGNEKENCVLLQGIEVLLLIMHADKKKQVRLEAVPRPSALCCAAGQAAACSTGPRYLPCIPAHAEVEGAWYLYSSLSP